MFVPSLEHRLELADLKRLPCLVPSPRGSGRRRLPDYLLRLTPMPLVQPHFLPACAASAPRMPSSAKVAIRIFIGPLPGHGARFFPPWCSRVPTLCFQPVPWRSPAVAIMSSEPCTGGTLEEM